MLLQGAQIETTRHGTRKIRTLCLLFAPIDQREVLKIHSLSGDNTTQQGDQQKKKTPSETDEKARSWLVSCELSTMTFNEEGYAARLPSAAAHRSSPAHDLRH